LTRNVGIVYPETDSWHRANVLFLSGYELRERKVLIDKLFKEYKDKFGKYPLSVGAWWIDAYSLNYMKSKYDIKAILVCADQFSTDGYQIWGQNISFKRPWKRVRLVDLFKEHTKIDFETIDTLEEAIKVAKSLGVEVQDYMTDGEVLLEIFEKKCTTALVQPTFVYDYPADFYPLAKKKKEDTRFVESFDIYVAGMEMGTNYTEQNDPEEIRVAWLKEKEKIAAGNPEGQIMDEAFLEALEYGMPPTSGIGPGIDRWVMVMTDSATISDVIAFPMQRAEK
jgi:lysyl-tRNA synthetase class 2